MYGSVVFSHIRVCNSNRFPVQMKNSWGIVHVNVSTFTNIYVCHGLLWYVVCIVVSSFGEGMQEPLLSSAVLDEDYCSGALVFLWHHTSPTMPAHLIKQLCVCVKLVQGQCENAGLLWWKIFALVTVVWHGNFTSCVSQHLSSVWRDAVVQWKNAAEVTGFLKCHSTDNIHTNTPFLPHTHPVPLPHCQNHGTVVGLQCQHTPQERPDFTAVPKYPEQFHTHKSTHSTPQYDYEAN